MVDLREAVTAMAFGCRGTRGETTIVISMI